MAIWGLGCTTVGNAEKDDTQHLALIILAAQD